MFFARAGFDFHSLLPIAFVVAGKAEHYHFHVSSQQLETAPVDEFRVVVVVVVVVVVALLLHGNRSEDDGPDFHFCGG